MNYELPTKTIKVTPIITQYFMCLIRLFFFTIQEDHIFHFIFNKLVHTSIETQGVQVQVHLIVNYELFRERI